jgi:hypothetical protein
MLENAMNRALTAARDFDENFTGFSIAALE